MKKSFMKPAHLLVAVLAVALALARPTCWRLDLLARARVLAPVRLPLLEAVPQEGVAPRRLQYL